jgi:hypothetical protein
MAKDNSADASAIVAELQQISNVLITRCAKHAAENAQLATSLRATLGEVEALKTANADLQAQVMSLKPTDQLSN